MSYTWCYINPCQSSECSSRSLVGAGRRFHYQLRDTWFLPRLPVPPFRYVQSQAGKLFVPAVISCPVSKAEATYEQNGYFRKEQLLICTKGQVSVLTEWCRWLRWSESAHIILPDLKRPERDVYHSTSQRSRLRIWITLLLLPSLPLHDMDRATLP